MPKKPDEDDNKLFQDAMRGVKPLVIPTKISAITTPLQPPRRRKDAAMESEAPLSDYETLTPLTSEDLVDFKRPGIQHKVLRKLRQGQYNVEAILDLHGKTVVEAREILYAFLLQCQKRGISHVLIVHGKGRISGNPILKNKLNHWLRQLDFVLAFCSANGRDGRSGAMYVLLKNQKGR